MKRIDFHTNRPPESCFLDIIALAKKVDDLAVQLDRSRGWIVKQALTAWVEREEERIRLTMEGLADVDAGRIISHAPPTGRRIRATRFRPICKGSWWIAGEKDSKGLRPLAGFGAEP